MGHNDHIDFDLHYAIEELLDAGLLEKDTPAYGVAQQVIHSGYDSLTEKQRWVYEKVVVPALQSHAEELELERIKNSN